MMILNTAIALALLVPLAPLGVGQPGVHGQDEGEGYEAIRDRELPGLLAKMSEHADWCRKKKLWLQRALAYEAVLRIDPDRVEAHRGLGHKKGRDGSWAPSNKPRPKDRGKKADLLDAVKRREELCRPFVEAALGFVKREGEELNRGLKKKVVEDLIAMDPENEWAHAQRFEVKHEGNWVMMELVNTRKVRAEIKELIKSAREDLKAADSSRLTALEEGLKLDFSAALESESVRVLGTVGEEEVVRCSENLRVMQAVFQELIDESCAYPEGFTYFLLGNDSERSTFLDNHPGVAASDRAYYESLETVGIKPEAIHYVSWTNDKPRRLDSACRQGIANLLMPLKELNFEGWEVYGWAFEGVGNYFTHAVAGTHLTWFIAPSKYLSPRDDALLRAKLMESKLDWLREARIMMEEGKLPKFHSVVGRGVNRLTTDDLLLCNAAVAYLLEGRPGVLPKILKKIGHGRTAHETFLEELGINLLQFDERLKMWLAETAD